MFGHFLGRLFEGQLFGEISLLKPGVRRDMTVVADEQVTGVQKGMALVIISCHLDYSYGC